MTTYKVEWETDHPEFSEDDLKKIAADLADISEKVEKPGDLIFHHVWLTEDMNGPVVMIYGKEENLETFFMSYYETSEWTILEDNDALEI